MIHYPTGPQRANLGCGLKGIAPMIHILFPLAALHRAMAGNLQRRERLLEVLQRRGDVSDEAVIAALEAVPREAFLPADLHAHAYDDTPLPIGQGQTISAPHMVAIMAQALQVGQGQRVLEIGGGCGYHAAVLAHLVGPHGHIWSVERLPGLAAQARANLSALGLDQRVTVVVADGSLGYPEQAPYDRISVACAAPAVPPALLEQLSQEGILLVPTGTGVQRLLRVRRKGAQTTTEDLGGCVFVPLVGRQGFGSKG